MRALVVETFGGPEALVKREVDEPKPGPGEVAIAVDYAGVNFADVMDRRGSYGHGKALPLVPGLEVSGRIRAVGSGVTGFDDGSAVVALVSGGYADVALAKADLVVRVDGLVMSLGADVSAAAPVVFSTAQLLIADLARLREGETLLVHASAGGVGTAVAQLARRLGIRLIGTVSQEAKMQRARSAGYDEVILRDGFAEKVRDLTDGRGVDAVFESIGGRIQEESFSVLAPLGRLVIMGNATGSDGLKLSPQAVLAANAGVLGFSLTRLCASRPELVRGAIGHCLDLLASGAVNLGELHVMGLSEVAVAHAALEAGSTTGKFVLDVSR